MKFIAVLLCLLFLISCKEESNNAAKLPEVKKDSLPLEYLSTSTAFEVEPLKQLPPGFHLDSLFKTDTLLNHQTTLYYPVSETDPAFNRKLRLFIEKYESEYKPDERGDKFQSSVFDLWITGARFADKKMKFKFMMQGYYPGAAHYNHDSAVFNYRGK
jgi:hypothetical protein